MARRPLDDNVLKNYSIKGTASLTGNQKLMVSYLWNDKIRGHRRDGNDLITDIAAVVQTNPGRRRKRSIRGCSDRAWFTSRRSA